MKIKLSKDNLINIIELSKKRVEAKSSSVRRSNQNYKNDEVLPHIDGIVGEWAYSKLINYPINEEIYCHGDKEDFPGIEVKTSTFKGKNVTLKIEKKKYQNRKPEYYVLMKYDKISNEVEFIGSISRVKFDKIKESKNYGYVDNWIVNEKDLDKNLINPQ